MKPSLEEERRVLLAQIEASRASYRRMLSGAPVEPGGDNTSADQTALRSGSPGNFPRSRTIQWMMAHPLAVAAGVSLLVWVAPRWWTARGQVGRHRPREQRTEHHGSSEKERRRIHRDSSTEGTGRALLTAAVLMMRNPATMRTLGRAAGTLWRWYQQRHTH